MRRVCENCTYFVQVSWSVTTYAWGDCVKGTHSADRNGKSSGGAFMWADKTCPDFKSKYKAKRRLAPNADGPYDQILGPSELDQNQPSES
jgi:hypothetical protein